VLATGPNVADSNQAKGDEFLRVIEIHSTPHFGWEAKPSVTCSKILLRQRCTSAKFKGIFRQLPASLLGICCNQRDLVDESAMFRLQMGSTIDQKMAEVHGTLCTIPLRNGNQSTASKLNILFAPFLSVGFKRPILLHVKKSFKMR
jgi:hypothetical protein